MPENSTTQQNSGAASQTHSNPASKLAEKATEFAAHKAHPGPAVPQNMPQQEGTKEERQAKAKELNK